LQVLMLSFPRHVMEQVATCSDLSERRGKRESSISIEYFWIPDQVGNDRKYSAPQ
jgi:hypothetical protein